MPQPVVMISHVIMAPIAPVLEAQGWRVVRRWALDETDRAAVQAVVHAGEFALPPAELETLPAVRLIAHVSVGYEGVDVAWCRARGIEVTHSQGENAEDVATHAMGLLLALWSEVAAGDRTVKEGRWRMEDRMRPRRSLSGRRMGIVGLGHIGEAVARRAEPFGLGVSWWGPREKPGAPWPRAASVMDLARASDILVVAARPDATNRGLISRDVIEALGPQGVLINVARAALVDEDALVEALRDGRLGGAGLDVFAEEPTPASRWADLPNVIVTPHRAGSTDEALTRMVAQAVENIRRVLAGEPAASPVPDA